MKKDIVTSDVKKSKTRKKADELGLRILNPTSTSDYNLAVEELIQQLKKWVLPEMTSVLKGRNDLAEDLFIETLWTYCLKADQIKKWSPSGGTLYSWCARVLKNASLSLIRLKKQYKDHESGKISLSVSPKEDDSSSSDRLESSIQESILGHNALMASEIEIAENEADIEKRDSFIHKVLEAFENKNEAKALWMKYGEGLSITEIAETLGFTESAVKSALHRGKTKFQKLFNSMGSDYGIASKTKKGKK